MTTGQDQNTGHQRDGKLPTVEDVWAKALNDPTSKESCSIDTATKTVKEAFKRRGKRLEPLEIPRNAQSLARTTRLFQTRIEDPLDSDNELNVIVVSSSGEWTSKKIDTFIATMAPVRRGPGLPQFAFYGTHATPPELTFLFETDGAGILEISAWDIVEEQIISSDDCAEYAAAGRLLLRELYEVDLEPVDLQWLSVIHQVIDEELRWFSEDPQKPISDEMDYLPFASLLLLGCIAGETLRLNHEEALLWSDAEGSNWPRLGHPGSTRPLTIIDATFKRFEGGSIHDLWQGYQTYYTTEQLDPPQSFTSEIFNPLDFLPNWDPSPDLELSVACDQFRQQCKDVNISIETHPIPFSEPELRDFLAAFTCTHEDLRYDLFVSTASWTDERTRAFLRNFGHRSLEDWEIGISPVFVFFSGYPLSAILEYSFISGPPIAPLEGLANVETPASNTINAPDMITNLANWLLEQMEQYTTIGLELNSQSVLPGLEFFVQEELSEADLDAQEREQIGDYEPLSLLTAIGLTAGESVRRQQPDRATWVFDDSSAWPAMDLVDLHKGSPRTTRVDWVAVTRAIWRGDSDSFKV